MESTLVSKTTCCSWSANGVKIDCCSAVQGEDPDYAWAVTVIMFYLQGLGGLIGTVFSLCWMVQVRLPDTVFIIASSQSAVTS
jgi:hypothetical protein